MKATKFDGLVRCTVKKSFRSYREGDTIRLSPSEAQLFVGGGFVEEVKLPKGIAAEKVKGPEPEPVPILPNPLLAVPEDWHELHGLQRRKIASQIAKREVPLAEADAIIKAELERRLTE
jgi:hypothetical protein